MCQAQPPCRDDPYFTFGSYEWTTSNNSKETTVRTCAWLTQHNAATRTSNWCDYETQLGALVRNKCQDACSVCNPILSTPDPSTCKDFLFNRWMDTEGRDCAFYEQGNNCNDAAGRDAIYFKTGQEACCGCAGGGCYDKLVGNDQDTKWYDLGGPGFDCEWYEAGPDRCTEWGSSLRNFGHTADEVCCVCGGGNGASRRNLQLEQDVSAEVKSLKDRNKLRRRESSNKSKLNN